MICRSYWVRGVSSAAWQQRQPTTSWLKVLVSTTNEVRKVTFPLHSALVRLHLETLSSLGLPSARRLFTHCPKCKGQLARMVREGYTQRKMDGRGAFSFEKSRQKVGLTAFSNQLIRVYTEDASRFFLRVVQS